MDVVYDSDTAGLLSKVISNYESMQLRISDLHLFAVSNMLDNLQAFCVHAFELIGFGLSVPIRRHIMLVSDETVRERRPIIHVAV